MSSAAVLTSLSAAERLRIKLKEKEKSTAAKPTASKSAQAHKKYKQNKKIRLAAAAAAAAQTTSVENPVAQQKQQNHQNPQTANNPAPNHPKNPLPPRPPQSQKNSPPAPSPEFSRKRPAPQEKNSPAQQTGKKQKTNTPAGAATVAVSSGLSAHQQSLATKLSSARFRWLNEKLYTTDGQEAFQYFSSNPGEFSAYHAGFREQAEKWPENPLDHWIRYLKGKPKGWRIGDFGCGDARLAEELSDRTVHSFDLVAVNDRVTACNIADVPLKAESLDAAVFCLSLMGSDYGKFIKEAARVLKDGGELLIAEVRSRFSSCGVKSFIDSIEAFGFSYRNQNSANKMFLTMQFTKGKGKNQQNINNQKNQHKTQQNQQKNPPNHQNPHNQQNSSQKPSGQEKKENSETPKLSPCIYKKR